MGYSAALPPARSIYGDCFREQVQGMGTAEVLIAAQSPGQSPYVERLIGSVRRECLDHMMVFSEASLRRILRSYFDYYQQSRTHLALDKDAAKGRAIQPPELGAVVELPEVGGLHHRYERRAAGRIVLGRSPALLSWSGLM